MAETTALALTEDQERRIASRFDGLLAESKSLAVEDGESERTAWAIVNGIGEFRKMVEADFAPAKRSAHGAWKAICAQEAGHLERLKEPDRIVRQKLGAWETEKRKRQQEAERIARELAMAEARERAKEEARRREEEARLQAAIQAEAAGRAAEAEELLRSPVEVPVETVDQVVEDMGGPVVVLPRPAPKAEGAGAMVEVWHFEVVSSADLPREYLQVDETAIRRAVARDKGNAHIPGVRVYSTVEPRRRG